MEKVRWGATRPAKKTMCATLFAAIRRRVSVGGGTGKRERERETNACFALPRRQHSVLRRLYSFLALTMRKRREGDTRVGERKEGNEANASKKEGKRKSTWKDVKDIEKGKEKAKRKKEQSKEGKTRRRLLWFVRSLSPPLAASLLHPPTNHPLHEKQRRSRS